MRVHPMWNDYPNLKIDLNAVLQLMESHIKIHDDTIESTIKNLIYSGGKLLRPAYSLLCAQVGPNYDKEKAVAVSAALEVLHMATLVHDDVIDDATSRHGIPTIQQHHGNQFAIYSGDYLFCVCFTILARYANSLAHLEFNSLCMEKILRGELEQLHSRYESDVSLKRYLSRISGKTAQLFAVSCYSGAIASEPPRRLAMNAWNMGHYIGMAFQIMDDILDYRGDQKQLGKPIMADVRQGLYTLPLIIAMQANPAAFGPLLSKKEKITDQELEIISDLIDQYQGIEKAKILAEKYTKKAMKHLNKLPDGDYKQVLKEITTKLLERIA